MRASATARAHVRDAPRAEGRKADVFIATASGALEPLLTRYELREVDALVTSHDARTFAVNPLYPAGVQERRYHADPYERLKVARNAAQLVPAFVLNTNPDSVNGPPVIDADGIVLGGNSRAMTLQLAYAAGNGEGYRALLVERARVFGFEPRDLDRFKRPALVRVVDVSRDRYADLSRRLNESQTQEKDAATDAASLARRISDVSLSLLASDAAPDDTLDAFLRAPAARAFIGSLVRDGVLSSSGGARYLIGAELTEDGRTLVKRAIVSRIVPDAATIAATPPARRDAVARAAPALLAAAREGHDVSGDVATALEDLRDAAARGLTIAELDAQEGFAFTATRQRSPATLAMRNELEKSPRAFVARARRFAELASREPAGQASLFGAPRSTGDLWNAAGAHHRPNPEQSRPPPPAIGHDPMSRE